MSKLLTMALGLVRSFGGLILYWTVLLSFGIRPAIAATIGFVLIDGGWRLRRGQDLPRMWLFSNGLAMLFGIVDLWARTPFMIRYEGAIMNLVAALLFGAGAFGKRPIVLDIAQARPGGSTIRADLPEIIRYFRALTLVWAGYMVVRAGAALYIMAHWPLPQAIAIRTLFGWITLGAMILASMQSRHIFRACQAIGLFRPTTGIAGEGAPR